LKNKKTNITMRIIWGRIWKKTIETTTMFSLYPRRKTRIRPLNSLVQLADERHAEVGDDFIFQKHISSSQQWLPTAARTCSGGAVLKCYGQAIIYLPLCLCEGREVIENEALNGRRQVHSWISKNDTGPENLSPPGGEESTTSSNKRQSNHHLFQDCCPSCRQWWNFYFNHERNSSLPGTTTTPQHQMSSSSTSSHTTSEDIDREKCRLQAELNRLEAQGDCPSCLWTGVLTCLGLSAYFGNIAWEEYEAINSHCPSGNGPPTESSASMAARKGSQTSSKNANHDFLKIMQQKRRFGTRPLAFGALSIGWLGLGAYRYHLG
jgi:hypothetical protein